MGARSTKQKQRPRGDCSTDKESGSADRDSDGSTDKESGSADRDSDGSTELKEALVSFYNYKESIIPASPLVEETAVPLTELYVQPPMSAFIKPYSSQQKKQRFEKTPVRSYSELFLNHDNKPYRNIYVEADAGYGKTSFTQKIALTWCLAQSPNESITSIDERDIDTLKRFDFLFLLHLRDFQGKEICRLDDLILEFLLQYLPNNDKFTKEFIGRILQNKTCLAIIDGLDEWVHHEKCPQKPGIPHNYHERLTQLTTTRPWKLSTIGLTPNLIDRHLEISKLDKETSEELKANAVKILRKEFGKQERDLTDFDRKVSSVKLGEFQWIPYILLQLICIWFDGFSIGKSKCETYSNTIQLTLKRGLEKKNAPNIPTGNVERNVTVPRCISQSELCEQYVDLLLKLGNLAFYSLFQKIKESSLVIESTTVLKFLTEQELEFCLKIGLLSQTKDSNIVSQKRYKVLFQHKSVQEFMAALYIASEWNDGTNGTIKLTILEVCSSLSSILEMENVFVFICGMNPVVYTCISGELQKIVDLDSVTCRYRTYMHGIVYDNIYYDDRRTIQSYQSMQLQCLQESLRNGNDSCPIPLSFVLDKHSLTYDLTALKSIMQFNESNGNSLQVSLNEKIVAFMLSQYPVYVFMQSLDPGKFTALVTLRVEECREEPVWLADVLTKSARTMKCLTLSRSSLSRINIKTLTGLTILQSLHLDNVRMAHSNIKCLFVFISQTTKIAQLKLARIHCSDHHKNRYCDCDVILDLHRLNEVKMLHLHNVPCRQLHVNPACLEKLEFHPWEPMTASASAALWQDLHGAPVLSLLTLSGMSSDQMIQTIPTLTQLHYLRLEWIYMNDVRTSFTPAMARLERVELFKATMSRDAWMELFLSVGQLSHPVTVELFSCWGPPMDEWQSIVNEIMSIPTLTLLPDYRIIDLGTSLTLKNYTK